MTVFKGMKEDESDRTRPLFWKFMDVGFLGLDR
ncbi:hypothetical protein Dpep_1615 [Dethiosulfovibrio peptidovorans DSM 11002]|uniref:Uncharacterized protein n=1 Tax=Dethiosulfovibrio peptidovorans DSM 11002 TaxID=469381 RepID=D2Z844_9BACT|nr:hypothetical protein Dpep_1615 [Dethiosulfovibrio peptidovorans DSM 11002]